MRVRHLTDFEIQGLLDRRSRAVGAQVPGETYLKDLESQEHLDNCTHCLAEVESYRELYCDLDEAEQNYLPRSFARKVTFSLPPFKTQRTRARLQIAGAWGAALFLTLLWSAGQIDWQGLYSKGLLAAVPVYNGVENWVTSTISSFEVPSYTWSELWAFASPMLDALPQAIETLGSMNGTIIPAGLALLLVASLDKLYLASIRQQRDVR